MVLCLRNLYVQLGVACTLAAAAGTPGPLRSPRSSLVSSPSSCDCPVLVGHFSSTGSDGGYARSPGYAATSSSVGCSHSLTTTPSPGKALGATASAGTASNGISPNGCLPAAAASEPTKLLMPSSSVRTAHHRHRQHKPGCRFHQQQQAHAQQQTPPGAQLAPLSPSTGGLLPQSSLRTALQHLETMASYRAGRIMDKLNAGLQKMTSHRVFDGVLRQGMVGREVRARRGSMRRHSSALGASPTKLQTQCKRSCRCLVWVWGLLGSSCTVGRQRAETHFCHLVLQVMRDWELGPTLGVGASCVTRLVTEKTTGRTAACKSISKQGILHSPQVKAAMLAVQREVAILQVGMILLLASSCTAAARPAGAGRTWYRAGQNCVQRCKATQRRARTATLTSAGPSCCCFAVLGVVKAAGCCCLSTVKFPAGHLLIVAVRLLCRLWWDNRMWLRCVPCMRTCTACTW
jgi:hypothetical protein